MRNIAVIAAALGFFLAAGAPSFATTADHSSLELSAATKKVDCKDPKNAKNKACMKKGSDLGTSLSAATKKVDCKDPKNAKNKACMKKGSNLGTSLSAATKKVDCKDPKNAKNKACAKKGS